MRSRLDVERLQSVSNFQGNHFHARAVAFADVVLGEFEALGFEQLHEPGSGKVVVVLELAPVRVRTRGIEDPPNDESIFGIETNSAPPGRIMRCTGADRLGNGTCSKTSAMLTT